VTRPLLRNEAFTVFAQQTEPSLGIAELVAHSARFFQEELHIEGLDAPPAGGSVGATAHVRGEARVCIGRRSDADDLVAAQNAESRAGYTGMSLLASRCGCVWLVEAAREPDHVALLIAAVFAGVFLGPILSPDGEKLFGVKTARGLLDR
jgi:hypothetical protein